MWLDLTAALRCLAYVPKPNPKGAAAVHRMRECPQGSVQGALPSGRLSHAIHFELGSVASGAGRAPPPTTRVHTRHQQAQGHHRAHARLGHAADEGAVTRSLGLK